MFKFNESVPTPEQSKQETHVKLHFFRHADKVALTDEEVTQGLTDDDVKLSQGEKGSSYAKSKSSLFTNLKQALAWRTSRKRTGETALQVMAGAQHDFSNAKNYNEMEAQANDELLLGSKIGIDNRLNFSGSKEYENAYIPVLKTNYVGWLVSESDKKAAELGDRTAATYTRQAGNVAAIISKYMQVSKNWNRVFNEAKTKNEQGVNTETNKYTDNTLERFLGSHQGVCESFLLKYVEKAQGIEMRDYLLSKIGVGFTFVQGFNLDIVQNKNGEQVTMLHFDVPNDEPLDIEITQDILQELIDEAEKSME